MEQKSCIYCGTTDNLSASDIIPDALTNAKVLNHCVCQIEHNNKFSDLFESDVIKKLAFITNELDVKSSKGKTFPKYDAKIIVDGKEYSTSISSNAELFRDNKIISSIDGTSKIGSIEQIKKIKAATPESISEIDLNNTVFEEKIPLNLDVFFSDSIYRLVSKIAYEWYCLCNNVSGKLDAFNNIIDYICLGQGDNPVSLVSNCELYKLLEDIADFGSHVLITYTGTGGSINAIISLFGIAIYNVRLLDKAIDQCKMNVNFLKLTLDSKRSSFGFNDINKLNDNLSTSFVGQNVGGFTAMLPKNPQDTSLQYQLMYLSCYGRFQKELKLVDSYNKEIIDLVIGKIHKVINTSTLTLKSLRRFVKDYEKLLSASSKLNFQTISNNTLINFYFLYIIGNPLNGIISFSDLNTFIKAREDSDKVVVNSDRINQIKTEMESDSNYFEYIKNGTSTVQNWQ